MSQKVVLVTACGAEREKEFPDGDVPYAWVVPILRYPRFIMFRNQDVGRSIKERIFLLHGWDKEKERYEYREEVK